MGFDLSPDTLRTIVIQMIILVLSITVHEFGHAIVADKLGDRLPRSQGRVTLNPMAHADPIGTLALPAMFLLLTQGASIGFGWGRPVQINPTSFTRRLRMKTGHMLVAAAGPGMNIAFGILISVILFCLAKFEVVSLPGHSGLMIGMLTAIQINFVLAFFNLIPTPPLDGGAVLKGLLPDSAQPAFRRFEQYGFLIFFAFIAIPKLSAFFVYPAVKLFEVWMGFLMGWL